MPGAAIGRPPPGSSDWARASRWSDSWSGGRLPNESSATAVSSEGVACKPTVGRSSLRRVQPTEGTPSDEQTTSRYRGRLGSEEARRRVLHHDPNLSAALVASGAFPNLPIAIATAGDEHRLRPS